MKNQTLIGLAATTLIALATIPAWSQDPNVTLTPFSLYGMIEKLQEKVGDISTGLGKVTIRVAAQEKDLKEYKEFLSFQLLSIQNEARKNNHDLSFRVSTIEMAKQTKELLKDINLLSDLKEKADKQDEKHAHVLKVLLNANQRIQALEAKVSK
jgi:hypothetical protein